MNEAVNSQVLNLANIRKEFTEPTGSLRVLRGVSLTIRPGEIVMIMGPSGSGKTTLLQIAGCLIRATSGQVEIAGKSVNDATERERLAVRRSELSFVFQSFHLVSALTAFDNIALALRLRRQTVARDRIFGLLNALGIGQKADKYPRDLSGGEKQRVAIGRGLVGRPRLLLADEPTSQLDANSAEAVSQLLRELVREYQPAVLLATHDPRLRKIADRFLFLEDGTLHA